MTQPRRPGGVLALAGFASLLGQLSRTPRLFLGLFLFGLYVAVNAPTKPLLDVVGFNGAATAHSNATILAAGLAALRHGALLVSGAAVPAGCFDVSRS